MISYKDTKQVLDARGIEITPSMFSFSQLVAIGIDPCEAYMVAIKPSEYENIKDDKLPDFEEKCKKECDILVEQYNVKQLIEYLTTRYKQQVNEDMLKIEDVDISSKQIKNIYGRIILKCNEDLDNASYSDLIKTMSDFMKNFPPSIDDTDFNRHFIQVMPSFNFCCSTCGREGDAPLGGCDFRCKHCGRLYKWSEIDNRYY